MSVQQYFTVKSVAERFAVPENKVLAWIKTGELSAVDVAQAKGRRPRWRIHIDEIERFELGRQSVPSVKAQRPATRRPKPLTEYVK